MQTTVATSMTKGIAGLPGDDSDVVRNVSAVSEESSTEVRAGIMVADGSNANGCLIPAAQEDLLKGVVELDQTADKDLDAGDTGYKPGAVLTIRTTGPIWVHVEGTLPTQDDEVHVRAEHTAAEPLGYFLNAAVSGKTIDVSGFCKWTGRTDTGIAEVEINMVNRALATPDA